MDSDRTRDARSPNEWPGAVQAYLRFAAGMSWRARFDPVRQYYLDGLRLLAVAQLDNPWAGLTPADLFPEHFKVSGVAEGLAGMGDRPNSDRGRAVPTNSVSGVNPSAGKRASATQRSARATQGPANHSTRRTA